MIRVLAPEVWLAPGRILSSFSVAVERTTGLGFGWRHRALARREKEKREVVVKGGANTTRVELTGPGPSTDSRNDPQRL